MILCLPAKLYTSTFTHNSLLFDSFNLKDAFFIYDNISDPKEIERLVTKGRESLLLLSDVFSLPLKVQMDILGMQDMDSTAKESLAEMKDYVITKHASSQLKSDTDSHDRSLLLAKLQAKKLNIS